MLCLLSWITPNEGLKCFDGGDDVAWWLMYKKPGNWDYIQWTPNSSPSHSNPFNSAGNMQNDDSNSFYSTIKQIWTISDDIAFFAYNDQVDGAGSLRQDACTEENGPNGELIQKCQKQANSPHSKGINAIDFSEPKKLTGYWIKHSVPVFPQVNPGEEQTNNDLFSAAKNPTFTQSLLCV